MSEWLSVLVVFWVLWLADGAKLLPRRAFTVVGSLRRRGRMAFSRLSLPGVSPHCWRAIVTDIPLSLSASGICNRPVGSAGRPPAPPGPLQAWRWEDVREVAVARGWLFVNGRAFAPDTGHVRGPELLALAGLGAAERRGKLRPLVARWFRPASLRRRGRLLAGRTRVSAVLNTTVGAVLAVITVYVAGNLGAHLPERWSTALTQTLPWLLLLLLAAHGVAVALAWRALRHLPAVGHDKRRSALLSALLLPPQALRLRSVVGDGVFPPQHPLAVAVAWAGRADRISAFFHTATDLDFPLPEERPNPLAETIGREFREMIAAEVRRMAEQAGVDLAALQRAPLPDSPASCSYCPRCHDQFVEPRALCPNGVQLRPLAHRAMPHGREGAGPKSTV